MSSEAFRPPDAKHDKELRVATRVTMMRLLNMVLASLTLISENCDRLLTVPPHNGRFQAMTAIWNWVDRTWASLASVKLTIVILLGLFLLSIPGMVILQFNISNVDPGVQYDYDFWKFGQITQLFTAYHSFWYVGLMVLLSMNLIACSVDRWPQMWKLANAKPVAWAQPTFERQPEAFRHSWKSAALGKEALLKNLMEDLKKARVKPVLVEDGPDRFQIFFQTGRWSRVANYLVHTSLLVIFAGAILTALYGFEGAANIPAGRAVDTFILFKEGKASGLTRAPGGLVNERMLGFRLQAEKFNVSFYDDFRGRPKEFVSKLNVIEKDHVVASKVIRVNDPMEYKNYVFYQASYGRLGDYDIKMRVIGKKDPERDQFFVRTSLGELQQIDKLGLSVAPTYAVANLQGLGPAVQFQEVKGDKPSGKPFWVLENYPEFDFRRKDVNYGIVVDEMEELFFTGLQIGYDPGAPIYWTGCFGMLLGTFYALFVTHKKYQLRFENGRFEFAGTIHRLPTGFEKQVAKWADRLRRVTLQGS